MYDFFISHSSIDKESIVDDLIVSFDKKGLNIWYDNNNIFTGDVIRNEITEGLNNSLCIILIITKNFFNSKWVFWESGFFNSFKNKCVIPIIYNITEKEILEITRLFGNLKYIDGDKNNNSEIVDECIKTHLKFKQLNEEYTIKKNFSELQKKYNTYENIGAGVICKFLKKHCDIYEKHSDLLIYTAKKLIEAVVFDYIEYRNEIIIKSNNKSLVELINIAFTGTSNLNIKNHFLHIAKLEDGSMTREDNNSINRILINILVWYSTLRYPLHMNTNNLEIVYPTDFKHSDFSDMYEIDLLTMRHDLIADADTTFEWYKYNIYTHIALRDIHTQKIIGYFSVLPVTNETYDMIVNGNFKDKNFSIKNIVQYSFPQFYRVYIASVAIHPDYQNTNAFSKLFNALIDLFISLAKDREIFISDIVAEASTEQGEKLCKLVNMNKITNTIYDTDIYSLTLIPPEFKFKNSHSSELKKICEKKYIECQEYFD